MIAGEDGDTAEQRQVAHCHEHVKLCPVAVEETEYSSEGHMEHQA